MAVIVAKSGHLGVWVLRLIFHEAPEQASFTPTMVAYHPDSNCLISHICLVFWRTGFFCTTLEHFDLGAIRHLAYQTCSVVGTRGHAVICVELFHGVRYLVTGCYWLGIRLKTQPDSVL